MAGNGMHGNPAWVRGMPSPNPTGGLRPGAIPKFLSQSVASADGKTSAERRDVVHAALYKIALTPGRDQMRALELLLVYDSGRPVQSVEHAGPGGTAIPLDLAFLGEDNLQKMREQMQAAQLRMAVAGDAEAGGN